MNPIRYTYSVNQTPPIVLGGQDVINMDWPVTPFQASVTVDTVSGSVTFGVEYTLDDIYKPLWVPGTARWLPFPADSGMAYNTTVNASIANDPNPIIYNLGPKTGPVMAIRMNITSITGVVNFTVIQGYPI